MRDLLVMDAMFIPAAETTALIWASIFGTFLCRTQMRASPLRGTLMSG